VCTAWYVRAVSLATFIPTHDGHGLVNPFHVSEIRIVDSDKSSGRFDVEAVLPGVAEGALLRTLLKGVSRAEAKSYLGHVRSGRLAV